MDNVVYQTAPARVVFGPRSTDQVHDEVGRLGRSRVLLITTPAMREAAARVEAQFPPGAIVRFDDAQMHTPVKITEQALVVLNAHDSDVLVAIGGGSAIGLAKALAVRTGLDQVVLPTTYSGSEVTPVLGETADGVKTTRSAPEIRPETVIYDVDLTLSMPVGLTVTSAVNALAHAAEALYSAQANAVTDALAVRAISAIGHALPVVVQDPQNRDARSELLEAAWLAGTCLGTVGMGLHHKLCHVLGGTFDLPHAATHTVVLPHALAYNAPAAPGVMRRIAEALGVPDAPSGLHDLISSLGGPTSLATLGLAEGDLARAAALAAASSYPSPRPVTEKGMRALLTDAWHGRQPGGGRRYPGAELRQLLAEVEGSFGDTAQPRLHALLASLVRHLHGYVAENDLTEAEWMAGIDFLTRTGQMSSAKRQEFILFSDSLGVSSAVDILGNSRNTGTTPSAVLGPFYVEGPPETPQGTDIGAGLDGVPLLTEVRVVSDTGEPLAGAVVDVWQSNKDGFYDVQLPEVEGPVLRARFRTDDDGLLRYWSILPSDYPIPTDGPVGEMLAATNRHAYRAAHVHFLINAVGHQQLITQLFPADTTYLDSDAVFGVKQPLIVEFTNPGGSTPDGREIAGEWRRLDYTFTLARVPAVATTRTSG
ncbi:alcohol dehydrogenase [Micromonospora acroterricola]|uniref:Alcohol dehydrogenase n=1 Tax=Micromonospora acroterricola TaxID=2202421 RepID=A0A317DEC4_9ACTN|nr:maleylacetate reductase and hydroxyquinol 1,2-dioxygenase domain-containing protein [Micromonospora acroterricola]PWR12652.1 alcohol dehydrogenase [Micromonospora acroterricola]